MKEAAAWISVAITIAGLIFVGGRIVERLEQLRKDFDKHESLMLLELREIRQMLACSVGGRRRFKVRGDSADDAGVGS